MDRSTVAGAAGSLPGAPTQEPRERRHEQDSGHTLHERSPPDWIRLTSMYSDVAVAHERPPAFPVDGQIPSSGCANRTTGTELRSRSPVSGTDPASIGLPHEAGRDHVVEGLVVREVRS